MTALSSFLFVKAGVVVALAPVPELGFVLQVAGVGAAIGSVVALHARDAEADTWRITTAWGTLGLIVGAAIVVAGAM